MSHCSKSQYMETKNSLINMKNFNPIPFLVYHFFIALMLLSVGLFGQNISNANHLKKSEYIRPICVDETAKDTLALEYVEITDSTLLYLIDDAISKDSMCPYFDSCIAVCEILWCDKRYCSTRKRICCTHFTLGSILSSKERRPCIFQTQWSLWFYCRR